MNRFVPHQTIFDQARRLDKYLKWVLIASTALTVISIILDKRQQIQDWQYKEIALTLVNAASSLCVLGYFTLDIIINIKLYKGGALKRLDLVDNAFDTNYTGERSKEYFNAQGVESGIYKLAVLAFENSLFTSEIAKRMTIPKLLFTAIIAAVFFLSASIGSKDITNNIIQLAATGILIQQAIKYYQYANRMEAIHDDFKKLFTDLKGMPDKSPKNCEIIKNVLNYEATHSWGGIILDSNIFKKLNPKLSEKWEAMKKTYSIS
jgi:hypothetical protein